jgi:hypothetical protein
LITSLRSGKDVPEIDPAELETVPVPVVSAAQQDRVGGFVRGALDALDRANSREDEAQSELLAALNWTDGD